MSEPRHLCPEDKTTLVDRIKILLSQRPEVDFGCVIGSFLETERGFRDIDIAVWVDPSRVEKKVELDYQWDLSRTLEKNIRHPIDISVLNYASLGYKYAASGGLLVWAKDPVLWYDFRERTWLQYLDFAPLAQGMLFDALSSTTE